MHCRRVRSYLSAFSNDELTGAVLRQVREHLASCRECRSEEAIYRSVRLAGKQLPGRRVGVDFNARILDRIAKERFAQTRTQAYLPKAAPAFLWRRLVPVLSSVAVIALAAVGVSKFSSTPTTEPVLEAQAIDIGKDDSYKSVMPLARDWSLNNHVAQADRISNLTSSMTHNVAFDQSNAMAGLPKGVAGVWVRSSRMPGMMYFYQVRPVIRNDNQNAMNASYKESDKVY